MISSYYDKSLRLTALHHRRIACLFFAESVADGRQCQIIVSRVKRADKTCVVRGHDMMHKRNFPLIENELKRGHVKVSACMCGERMENHSI